MIGLVNNFAPKTGIGKYSFNLFEQGRKELDLEMIYLESNDNRIEEMEGVKKVRQGFNLPVFNKSLSWGYYFPAKVPAGYELYHLSSQFLARVANFRQPCLITHMDLAPLLFPKEYPWITHWLLKQVMPAYKKIDRIITISESAKEELVRFGYSNPEKVTVIPPGFDERFFQPVNKEKAREKLGLPLDKKIVLNIGSEEPRKNIPCLLKTCKILQEKGEDFILVRVGNRNDEYDGLKKGLPVLEFNKVPEGHLPLFYSAADVFLFPATYEGGFAYPPLEAMACGLPTIVGEELRMFEEGAQVVDVSRPEIVAETVQNLLASKRDAVLWAQRGLKESKEYTLNGQIKKTLNVYEEMVRR